MKLRWIAQLMLAAALVLLPTVCLCQLSLADGAQPDHAAHTEMMRGYADTMHGDEPHAAPEQPSLQSGCTVDRTTQAMAETIPQLAASLPAASLASDPVDSSDALPQPSPSQPQQHPSPPDRPPTEATNLQQRISA